MHTAITINNIVDSLWPQSSSYPDPQTIERNLNTFNKALGNLSLNQLYQILELSSPKALFMVLQKCDIFIQKFINDKPLLLASINDFFMTWLHPSFQYDLKRSFDQGFIELHIERSISRFLGKILKQISKSNLPNDWEIISNYLHDLSKKNNYFQVLVMSGYFDQIDNIESEYDEQQMTRDVLKNFEYEIISKAIKLAIKNVSFCKQTLELLQIEHLQSELTISLDCEKEPMNHNAENSFLNSGKIKFLKYNFELIKKIINFNYDLILGEYNDPDCYNGANDKCSSFPDYIIKPILQDSFLSELYEIATLLLNLKVTGSQSRVSFGDIILELINKIIKTRILDYQNHLKEKFVREVLEGQTKLMKVAMKASKIEPSANLVLKIVKGNLKMLKNTLIVDLVLFEEAKQWLSECFRMIEFVLEIEPHLGLENYLVYKALTLCKQIVYQSVAYGMNGLHQGFARDIVSFGLKNQQNFVNKFICCSSSKNSGSGTGKTIVQCYSLEDMKEKRDRYFLNIKILSHIYLPVFNNLLKDVMFKIDSVQKASKLLFLMSYLIGNEIFCPSSFYYTCKNKDFSDFKKLAIGNCFVLIHQIFKELDKGTNLEYQIEDVIFLYIEKILKLHLESQIEVKTALLHNEIIIKTSSPTTFPELSSHSKLLTSYFTWMLKIIKLKVERSKNLADLQPYFKVFIKYLRTLIEDNETQEKFQIVSIQCELIKELIQFKNCCRMSMSTQSRKYLSELSIWLHQAPEITSDTNQARASLILFEIRALIEILQLNPNDWIGICNEIAGFLDSIDDENTYMKVISLIGVQFIDKICQSCLQSPNLSKINLFVTFTNSLVNLHDRVCVKNLPLWLNYLKPIFLSWTQCFKLMSSPHFKDQEWNEVSYNFFSNFLTNNNINFYLLQRSFQLKETFTAFIQTLLNFLNYCLEIRTKTYTQKDVKLFKILKILFRDFSEYFWIAENNKTYNGFFSLISKLIFFGASQMKLINNRKSYSIKTAVNASKAIKAGIDEMMTAVNQGKYTHTRFVIDDICTFLNSEKPRLTELQKQLDLARPSLTKFAKNDPEKVKKSDLQHLRDLYEAIYQMCKEKNDESKQERMEQTEGSKQLEKLQKEFSFRLELEPRQIEY